MSKTRVPRKISEAFAHKVVDYYVNVAKRNKNATVHHFLLKGDELLKPKRKNMYRIIRRFEERGSAKYKKVTGRKTTYGTPENLQKLANLYIANPALSLREAGHLMKTSPATIVALLKILRANDNKVPSSDSEPKVIEATAQTMVKCERENAIEGDNHEGYESDYQHHDMEFDFNSEYFDDLCDAETETKSDCPTSSRSIKTEALKKTSKIKKEKKTKNPPKPSGSKKSIQKAQKCLVCFDNAFETVTTSKKVANTKAIFMLQKLLEISSDDIAEFMISAKGDCPTEWFKLCPNCQIKLDEAFYLHEEILNLIHKIFKSKEEFIRGIRCSAEKARLEGRFSRKGRCITSKVRELVCTRNKWTPKPMETFMNADEKAENMAKQIFPSSFQTKESGGGGDNTEGGNILDDVDYLHDGMEDDGPNYEGEVMGQDYKHNIKVVEETTKNATILINERKMLSPPIMTPETININSDNFVGPTETTSGFNIPLTKISPICDICGEDLKFTSLSYHKLKKHGVVMDGFTVRRCDVEGCKYESFYEHKVIEHKRKHDPSYAPVLSHVCQYCGKKFSNRKNLKNHESIHKNAETRPYKCELCGSAFAVRNYLYIHKKVSHKNGKFPSRCGAKKNVPEFGIIS